MTILEPCKATYADCPLPTWRDQADWVKAHHTQDTIYALCVALYEALDAIPEEGPAKDDLREEASIFWFALDDEVEAKLEQHLAARDA